MGWLIGFGILAALAILPLGIRIRYDEDALLVRLIIGPIKVVVYPVRARKKKEKQSAPANLPRQEKVPDKHEKPLPKPPQPPKPEKPKKGGSLLDFLPLVKVALDFLGDFRCKLRIDNLYLRLVLASSDPCDLAVNYGRTWAAVGNLMPQLERLFVIKKRDLEVECDFSASETLVTARVDVTITLGRLLSLTVIYGVRALKEILSIQKKRKGGAVK